MKNKLEKQLRSFIDFDYSKRTIDRFHRWMISSDSAEEKETALRNLWFKTKGKAEHDMEYSFRQVLDKIGIEYTPMVTDVNRWNLWKSVAAAAVIVVLSVTATLWISYNHFDRDNIAMVEHYVNNGTRETISLPDGTTVHLNSGSHVFYPENLEGKTRTIYLIGEAEFKVARNPKKPFIVRSSNMAITALGTEFNVKAYPEEDVITASLIEGKVRVDCNDTISYVLTPGYQVVYNKCTDDCQMLTANMKNVTAKSSDFVVDEETGSAVVHDGAYVTIGGMITEKTVKTTRNNKMMAFLTVEDLAGSVEVLVFPKDYEKRRDMLIKDEKVFIRGRASVGDEPVGKLICEQIIPFSQVPRELWIQYADKDAYLAGEKELLDLLKTSDGNDTVIIYLGRERAKKVLPRNWNVRAGEALVTTLSEMLGEKNVKVVEKPLGKISS